MLQCSRTAVEVNLRPSLMCIRWRKSRPPSLRCHYTHDTRDKYEIRGLQACVAEQFPASVYMRHWSGWGPYIEKHYNACFDQDCTIGRKICTSIVERFPESVRYDDFEAMAKAQPKLAQDMFWVARGKNGRLW